MPMLESLTWQLKKVELRAAIDSFPDDGSPDDLLKITAEFRNADARYAAAIIKEAADADAARAAGDLNAGQRELDGIGAATQFRNYVLAAVEHRAADGAEHEYNAGHGMGGGQFPLAMLAPQMRATTNTDGQVNQQRWLDRLFADTAAMRLGITMESVPPGQANYITTTAGASGAQRGRTENAAAAAWTVGVTTLEPTRNAVHAEYAIEDAARLPGLSDALQRDLGMALVEDIDLIMFTGDTGANENSADIAGLTTIAITENTITQTNKVKPAESMAAFTGLVDGVYAGDLGNLNVVLAIGAWRLWHDTIANSAAENQTIAAYMRENGLAFSSRGGIEADTANGDFAAFVGRSRGIEGAGVHALWSAGQLIIDEITKAKSGEVLLTMNYLHAFALPRPANFARVKFVT